MTIPAARSLARWSLVVSAVGAVGCGSGAVNSVARQAAQAACLQETSTINNAEVKHSAERACRQAVSGDPTQIGQTLKQAARQACRRTSRKIVDPVARAAAEAGCPAGAP